MKLVQIYASNFKGFSEISLELQGKSTVFFGVNGVGKTSILTLINYMFRPWCNRLNPSQGKAFSSLNDEQVRIGQTELKMAIKVWYSK